MARRIPGKEEFHGLVAWYEAMLADLGVDVRLSAVAGADALAGFDEIIVATGVSPRTPDIAGLNGDNVFSYADILMNDAPAGDRVAIIGAGGIGFDVAEFLASGGEGTTEDLDAWRKEWGIADPEHHRGGLDPAGPSPRCPSRQVTLLQRKPERLGRRLGKTTGWIHRSSLRMKNVRMVSGVRYDKVDAAGVHISVEGDDRRQALIEADTVVVCAGQESERSLADCLAAGGRDAHVIGGACLAAELDAKHAIDQGSRLAALL